MVSSNNKQNLKNIKTIFLGNSILTYELLRDVTDLKAVFCRQITEDKDISYIKDDAKKNNISLYTPNSMNIKKNLDIYNSIKNISPDLIVSLGYHLIVPKEIIDIPKYCINLHGAPLPKYRGQHVLQWQIVNGEKDSAMTAHHMTPGIDDGNIIYQNFFKILPEDNAVSVLKKMHEEGKSLLEKILNDLSLGKELPSIPQDGSKATYFRARTPEDGKIDWNETPEQINNKLRALVYPWPGAYTEFNGKKIIIDSFEIKNISPEDIIIGTHYIHEGKLKIFGKFGLYTVSKKDIRNYSDIDFI